MEGKVEKLNCIRATQTHFYCWLHLLLVCLKLWEKRKKAKHSAVASHMPHACQQPDSEGGQYVRLTALHWHLAEQQTSNRRKQQLLDNNQQKIAVSTMCGKNLPQHKIKSWRECSVGVPRNWFETQAASAKRTMRPLYTWDEWGMCILFIFCFSFLCAQYVSFPYHFYVTTPLDTVTFFLFAEMLCIHQLIFIETLPFVSRKLHIFCVFSFVRLCY